MYNFFLGGELITNLINGSVSVIYENFIPYVEIDLPDQELLEDFEDDVVLDLDYYFLMQTMMSLVIYPHLRTQRSASI